MAIWEIDADKVGQLWTLFADKLLLFPSSISEDKRDTYEKLKKLVKDEYEDTGDETYAEQLTQRRLKTGEELSSLMADLKKMV